MLPSILLSHIILEITIPCPTGVPFCFATARTSHQSRNSASGRSTGCLAGISAHLEVALMWWCVAPSHQSTCNVKEVLPRETFFAGVVT